MLPWLTAHPLNRNRALWWAQLPELQVPGEIDITQFRRNGILQSASVDPFFRTRSIVPGLLARKRTLSAPITQNCVETPGQLTSLGITNAGSVALWVRFLTFTSPNFAASENPQGLGGPNADNAAIALVSGNFWTRWTDTSGTLFSATGGTATLGVWYRIVTTYDGANIRLYVDGRLVATTAMTGNIYSTFSGSRYVLGRRGFESTSALSGDAGDLSIWSRALSGVEIFEDYRQGLMGYPDLLRRNVRDGTLLTATAPAFNPAWAATNRYIGGGVYVS